MSIKQIFKSSWEFGSFFTPGSGARQRPSESFHYKQTKKIIKNQKKMFKTTRDIFLVLLLMPILLKYCYNIVTFNEIAFIFPESGFAKTPIFIV